MSLNQAQADELEQEYDQSLQVRRTGPLLTKLLMGVSLAFALYHYVTAGFGVPVDYWHMGVHLAGVFILVFLSVPFVKGQSSNELLPTTFWRFSNIPLYDWIFAITGVVAALYIGFTWRGVSFEVLGISVELKEQALRQGNPALSDVVMGSLIILVLLEAVRRTLGMAVPIIIVLFTCYALFGPSIPFDILKHPGVDWRQFINNMYFPQEGIFGVTLWVVSTVVFHFVLFGVLAQRMGLGQFFIDIATVVAGRFTGGLAKVSIVSSALFGTISGSSIANTVSTGSLTIPNMKRNGYPAQFAAAVESAASAGGQITPPIMGAAAFVMAEFLEVPYTTIALAALVPALMHYVGIFSIVHFTAKRLNLRGVPRKDVPKLGKVLAEGWPTSLPLVALIFILFSGYSPFMAAFWGITIAIAVGFLNPRSSIGFKDIIDGSILAVKYSLAVGAVVAAIGIVIGVVNTTGLGFRLGFLVTNGSLSIAESLIPMVSAVSFGGILLPDLTLFISLVLIAMACILMGAGLPTTALYIMLVTVAQPALASLGIPPLAAHLFVLYYGVISEITPPVCGSAYAAAGIAGSNPFKTGITAFTLGIGKLLVPMVFVYSPAMLIVIEEHFTWLEFSLTTVTCIIGIMALSIAITGYVAKPVPPLLRITTALAGMLLVVPNFNCMIVAFALLLPLCLQQYVAKKRIAAEPV